MTQETTVRKPYESDMSDEEWEFYKDFFPPIRGLREFDVH
jgi:hypothetical protein